MKIFPGLRRRAVVIVMLFASAVLVFSSEAAAQSDLVFPYTLTTLNARTAGYAIVNPTQSPATVTFHLFGPSGNEIDSEVRQIPSRGQYSALGSDLFAGPLASAGLGWIEATSPSYGLRGFWLFGDFETSTDGAEAATPQKDMILPFAYNGPAAAHIVNPGTQSAVVTAQLRAEDGSVLGSMVVNIEAHGSTGIDPSFTFVGADMDRAKYIRLTSTVPIAASLTIKNYIVDETAVINAINSAGSRSDLFFGHVLSGSTDDSDWTTAIEIINAGASTAAITLTFTTDNGAPVKIQKTLSPGGAILQSAQELFGPFKGFQNGWVRVAADQPLVGAAVYADKVHSGAAAVPAQTSGETTLLFAHIADLAPWYTGLALLNVSSTVANVEVFAFNSDGSPIGGATSAQAKFTLAAGAKTAKLLSEWIPATQQRAVDGGFVLVRTTNDVPLYGLELFFNRNLRVMANVPAQVIATPAAFSYPPSPPVPPVTYSVSAYITGSYGGYIESSSPDTRIMCFKDAGKDLNYDGPYGACQAYFPPAGKGVLAFTLVTLVAGSQLEYGVFDGWGGDCVRFGTNPICTLSMSDNMHVEASYSSESPIIVVKPPPIQGGSGGSGGSGSGSSGSGSSTTGSGRPGSIYVAFAVSAGFDANGGAGYAIGTNVNGTIGAANVNCQNASGTLCGDAGYCLGNSPSGRWFAFATDGEPYGQYAKGCGFPTQAAAFSAVLNACSSILAQCSVVFSGAIP